MTIDAKRIVEMYQSLQTRYSPEDAFKALRTEVHALLQLEKPFPHSGKPEHLCISHRPLTHLETRELHVHQREQVTEQEHLAWAKAHAKTTNPADRCVDSHHHVQKLHGQALWEETDRLLAAVFKPVKK